MPETLFSLLQATLATEGVIWIALAAALAGIVRGFSGFGTALIFLPVAALFLDPVAALICLTFMDILGPIPLLPRAWREADRPDLARLVLGAALALPLGLWVLLKVDPQVFRYGVSLVSLTLVISLVAGLRYRGRLRPGAVLAVGGAGGFLGGLAGLPGPPVILAYMAGPRPPEVVRANNMLYLYGFEFLLLGTMLVYGVLSAVPAVLGVLAAVPYALGSQLGSRFFDPARENVYRGVAYVIIAASAVIGLPIWEQG